MICDHKCIFLLISRELCLEKLSFYTLNVFLISAMKAQKSVETSYFNFINVVEYITGVAVHAFNMFFLSPLFALLCRPRVP